MLNKVWKEGKNCPLLKGVKWLGPLTCEDPLFLEQKSTHLYFPSRMFSKMELKLTLVDLVLVVSLPIRSFLFVHYLLYNNFFCLRESPHTAHLFIFWLSVSRVGTLMKLYWAQLRKRGIVLPRVVLMYLANLWVLSTIQLISSSVRKVCERRRGEISFRYWGRVECVKKTHIFKHYLFRMILPGQAEF